MRTSRHVLLVTAFALSAFAMPARADWKDDYSRGLVAASEGRWAEVSRLMDSAIAGNAQPAARVRLYGQRYEVYAPQHYAGLAALRRDDCAGALRYWEQAANTGFIAGQPTLAGVQQQGRNDCATRLASQAAPTRPATSPASAPTSASTTPPAVATTNPATPAAAQERPAAPSTTPAPPTRPPVAVAPPAQKTPPVATQAPAEAPPMRAPASAAAQTLQPLLAAYLAGRYGDVVRQSASSAGSTPRLRWHVLVLRSASAFNLAQLGEGGADAEATARQAAGEARKLDATLEPDPAFYSPRFIRFYRGR